MLDAALSATLAKIPDGQAKTDGVSLGKQVGEQTVALRVGDGADAKVAFNPKPGVGAYLPTPPQALAAVLPQWVRLCGRYTRTRPNAVLRRHEFSARQPTLARALIARN